MTSFPGPLDHCVFWVSYAAPPAWTLASSADLSRPLHAGEDNEKSIAVQQKKKAPKAPKEGRSVSLPPHLRTIVEQKSLEEREYEATKDLPPSPIQDFIDLAVTRRAGTWPKGFLPEFENQRDKDGRITNSASNMYSHVIVMNVFINYY